MPKITDLIAATGTDSPDVFPIVDIDDFTQNPAGTTKQATVAQLVQVKTTTLTLSSGSFTTRPVIRVLDVEFTGAGRLRLYSSSASASADLARAAGVLPTVSGLLYEYVADTNNSDLTAITLYPGAGATIYYQLDGGPTVTLTWLQDVS